MTRKIILDTDPGVDDAMAIAFALCHPELDLLGLTTVFGNTSIDFATRNAQYILEVIGAREVAVARGAAAPQVQTPHAPPDFVHGQDGLGNVWPAGGVTLTPASRHAEVAPLDAADFIIDSARRFPGEITLVAVGPLTNIAEALAREPDLPAMLHELVIMGGTLHEPGNVSPLSEANFWNDPHAADDVLAGDWPASIVGLDVTHRIMLSDDHLGRLRDDASETGRLLWETSRFYVDFYASRAQSVGGEGRRECAMHDAAAIARVIAPDAFETVRGGARVIPDGMAVGQLSLERFGHDYPETHWASRPRSTEVCIGVQADRVRSLFLDTVVDHHVR